MLHVVTVQRTQRTKLSVVFAVLSGGMDASLNDTASALSGPSCVDAQ